MIAAATYYENVNPDLLQFMPAHAGRVLEVGCGSGAFGKAYKQMNPASCYIGIELFEQVAEAARQHLDRVVCGDVETLSLEQMLKPEEKIECLVYGDVLEHLRDPWRVLRQHAGVLTDGGIVVACIPNVQHWSVLQSLLFGQWRYEDQGLLDRTHLRFFTLDGIVEMFSQAGLSIEQVQPRFFDHARQESVLKGLSEAAAALGVEDMQQFRLKTSAMQYVVRATKRLEGKGLRAER